MKPLSPEAKRALGALSAQEPSASDEARVRQNLERTLGVVLPAAATVGVTTVASTAVAATTTTTTTSALTSLGIGAKVTLFVAAISVGSLGTVAIRSSLSLPQRGEGRGEGQPRREPPPRIEVELPAPPKPPLEPEPEVVATAPTIVPAAPTVLAVPPPARGETAVPPAAPKSRPTEPAPEPVAVAADPLADLPPPPPPPTFETAQTQSDFATVVELEFPTCDAAVEARTAAAARRLLTEDRAPHALLLLGEYQRQCVSGQWSDEAWRVRLSSLCKLNRDKEAATLFEWFASEYPKRKQAIESELRVNCAPSVLGE